MSDFRSLLSTFQDATSTSAPSRPHRTSSSSSTQNKNSNKRKDDDNDNDCTTQMDASSLRKRTDRLWRITQIRKSTMDAANNPSEKRQNGRAGSPQKIKIAACACIVDAFPHEFVWKKWMEETGGEVVIPIDAGGERQLSTTSSTEDCSINIEASAELYVHAKNPEKILSPWLRSKTIEKTYRPNWNDVRIVRAMLALTAEALKDEDTTHILFCTESCIPITSLRDAALMLLTGSCDGSGDRLDVDRESSEEKGKGAANGACESEMNWNRSFVDYYGRDSRRCTRFDEQNCWDVLTQSVPPDAIYKALPGWCLLSRKHAQAVLDLPTQLGEGTPDLWPAFNDVWAPEEVYFPTVLALLGFLPGKEVVNKTITHSKWDERARNQKDRAHPLEYDDCFNKHLVWNFRREGCLFLRKMKRPLDIRIWERVALEKESIGEDGSGDQNGKPIISKKRRRDYTHDDGGYHGGDYYGRSSHSSSRRRHDRNDFTYGSRYR